MIITKTYSKEQYISDINHYQFEEIWDAILTFLKSEGESDFIKVDELDSLYEFGLSIKDKVKKKETGTYYTPNDVSSLMADFYLNLLKPSSNICDVCAGTGNLIIQVLKAMPKEQQIFYLENGKVYLYDIDSLALKIAINRIGYLFGYQFIDKIHTINEDFLNTAISLPENSIVISNPPYFKINIINDNWEKTPLLLKSKEYYGVFMEKCIKQAKACVFITPYSFVSGKKFYELRKLLNETDSKVLVFDNVPGNIFKGKKHGIFNSNTTNATRAAISIIKTDEQKGALISPMIRFSTAERSAILSKTVLESLLDGQHYQKISNNNQMYYKCYANDSDAFLKWISMSDHFDSLLSDTETLYHLDMATTCRYFTSASYHSLHRDGKYVLYFKNEAARDYAYILLNSSYAYWYWRIYDGAITYSKSLLYTLPINFGILNDSIKDSIHAMCNLWKNKEENYLVYKQNAKKIQENVKFPISQREMFNDFLSDLFSLAPSDFNRIHSPTFFGWTEL